MAERQTQCKQIVAYMKHYGSITSMAAIREFGCTRLASRIHDLRERGYEISKEMVEVRTANGGKTKVARYSLLGDEK